MGRYFYDDVLYRPTRQVGEDNITEFENHTVKDLFVKTKDENTLHAWFVPVSSSAPIVVYSHGSRGNIREWFKTAVRLKTRLNWSVLLYDYRGYGRSSRSRPTAKGLQMDMDAVMECAQQIISGERDVGLRNVSEYPPQDQIARERTKGEEEIKNICRREEINDEKKNGYGTRIILYGHSVGGAVTLDYIHKHPGIASLVVVENTFLSVREFAHSKAPVLRMLLPALLPDEWRSDEAVRAMREDVVFIYGTKDETVPYNHTVSLFNQCMSKNKLLIEIPGGFHNGTFLLGRSTIQKEITAFLKKIGKGPGAANADGDASCP